VNPDRRTVLKGLAMAAATAAATPSGAATPPPPVPDLRDRAGSGVSWQKAPCRFCGTGCHVNVGTQGGKVVAIAGALEAEVNKGLLCVKGYHVGLALYGQDRDRKSVV
jgi:nitrate reductase NapA